MKQVYPPVNCLSEIASTSANTKQQPSFFNRIFKTLSLLLGILLLLPGLSFGKDKKPFRDNWSNSDRYWTVSYNVTEGSIHVNVLVYDLEYGPANEDGYVDYAHLQYSTDYGANYHDFYYIDYNGDESEQSTTGVRGGANVDTTMAFDGRNTHINVQLNLTTTLQSINKIRIVGNWGVNGVYGSDDVDANKDVTLTVMSGLNTPTYDFVTVQDAGIYTGKARIHFSKTSLNSVDNLSTVKLFNSSGTAISGDMTIATDGYYDAPLSYAEQSYYFKQSAYGGRVTTQSSPIVVKAFTQPKSASAVYDTTTHKATFTWTMDSVTTPSNCVTDRFQIQVSPDENFSSGATVYLDYYSGQKTYSYTVDKNFSPTLYFRVARSHFTFEWLLAQVTHVGITFNPLLTGSVVLQNNNTGYITWDPRPSAWLPGCSFIIRRTNTTTNAQTQFSLGETDYKLGHYSDQQIAVCNQYTYSLQVQPPTNSDFTTYTAIQTGSILPTQTGTVSNLAVSKGYFPDRTELNWTGNGTFDNFIIKRAPYGSSSFVQLAKIPGATSGDFSIDDSKGTPGTYYTYMVFGTGTCNNQTVYSDTLRAVGFRSPTGNVYGRVTYESGQSVENVAVRMQSNDQAQLGQSVFLNGNSNSYLKLDSLKTPFVDSALTVEAWIKPTDSIPLSQVLFSRGGQYEFGFNSQGKLYFTYKDTTTTSGSYTITGNYFNPNRTFVHVGGIHRADSMFLLLNDSVIAKSAASYATSSPQKPVYIGSRAGTSRYYKGYIDEVRVWNVPLSTATVARDYTRLLSGGENGLAAYWRLDETIVDQFYDASHHGDQYNQNDGSMNWLQVTHSKTIPAVEQLGLKDFTDGSGNYMITGVPFVGNGTTYTIAPLLGTHQFDPTSANRLISTASPVFTLDFKDKSSFNVIGTVKYKNSTVPVWGVQFKIDGKLAQQSNGSIIQTDAEGKFAISVPIGVHEVQAVKNNHVFVNDGKITDIYGYNLDYQKDQPTIELFDSTTIRFIGRVAGGPVQEALPLGHSVSVNNLGSQLSITLKLPSDEKYQLRSRDTVVTNLHLLPSNRSDSGKIAKTNVAYQLHQVVIYPDTLTGEFVADLIPEIFKATDVSATGWGNILGANYLFMDFTNKFSVQSSLHAYVDSSLNSQEQWIKKDYSDTVFYNAAYKFIKREQPSVALDQLDFSGNPLTYFGNDTYQTLLFSGAQETVNVVDTSIHSKDKYIFGWPAFVQNQPYTFRIKAFEAYKFYDGPTHVKEQGGKQVIDNVPTRDGFVSINNNLRNGATTADTLSLNSDGLGYYQFIAGDPDLTAAKKDFAATVRFGQATYVTWKWYDSSKVKAYVLGGKLTGTDFVTAGPDKVLFVLRDPPGSKSFSSAEKGSVITSSSKYTGNIKNEGDEEFTTQLGYELITFTGIGVGVINRVDTKTGIGFGIHHEEHYTGSDTKENTTELTTAFKTSDDPLFVGPPADVFVGYSTNITYGKSNNITIVRRDELKQGEVPIYPPGPSSSTHVVVLRAGINIGEVFGTLFAYPQQHIQNILIPNLLTIRNSLLWPSTTSAAAAQAKADTDNQPVYVSKLPLTSDKYGKSNSDTVAFGPGAKTSPFGDGDSYKIYFPTNSTYRTDTILVLNQYVANWQKRMADNEKAKLEAVLEQNYSFHSGAPIEHSIETAIKTEHEDEFSFVIGGSVTNSTDFEALGSGFEFKFKEDITTEHGGTFVSSTENKMKYGFTLESEGTDDYFSVDVSVAKDSAFVFRTKGGSSGCPYAGLNLTKYYQPGTIMDQPTMRNEVPVIGVDNPVANNVPSSRKASFTLLLRNESEAKLGESYMLTYINTDSIKGATIAVDGLSIADGRTIPVQYGETVQKVLTIERGPQAMDYNNIMILWRSPCQYDPTGYRENIADTVLLSAHFIPSCSDIAIKFPKDKWVLNTLSDTNAQRQRYLPITIDQFDVNSGLFHHIELQYKSSTKSTWTTVMKFYYKKAKYDSADGPKTWFTDPTAINYNFVMDDANFSDQAYDIQAVSYCDLGGNKIVTTESNLVSGIKDTYSPRLFGSPQPANGILTVNDNIRLNFNETIAAGLMTNNNFQVTGIRNGAPTDHSVSVNLDGAANYLATEFDKSFAGKNITAEMWVNPSLNPPNADQTIFSHGDASSSLELAVTTANKLKVTVGGTSFVSTATLLQNQWSHVALVYNDNAKTITVFKNWSIVIGPSPVSAYTGTGHIEYGRSVVALNKWFKGKIHEARIWSDTLNGLKLQLSALKILSGTESNLLGYYPMNEGKGNVVLDKANGSNAALNGQWTTPPSKAVHLGGSDYVKINTSFAPIDSSMDYTLELWFKADNTQGNSTLASNGKGDGTDPSGKLDLFSLGFEGGLLTFRNNGFTVQATGNYLDNIWHHVAVSVNRNSGSGQLSVDGQLNQFFDAQYLGGIVSPYTYLGARAFYLPNDAVTVHFDNKFTGNIDEFRLWNTYLDQSFLSRYNNTRLQGNEVGLLAYYPFETYITSQGVTLPYYSLQDAKVQEVPSVVVPPATTLLPDTSDVTAPIKMRGPVENLNFDFVVNNDAVIINMLEPKDAIDKSVITFKARDVYDLNGNPMASPVVWTAYIDQHLVKWSDKEINLVKMLGDPLTFTSYIVNNGGNSQHFTISNLPSWLMASPSSGSVDPNSNQKITFTVSSGLNIGSYEEMITMRSDNNESEVLKLTLKVKGKQPDWVVNPSDYLYNMVVYGKLRFNNIFSANEEDMLGAFSSGKCIGVTHNTHNTLNSLWYAFLTMYSNDVTNTNIEFRLWEAKTGKIYIATTLIGTTPTTISFNNNTVVGTVGNPVIFDNSATNYRNIVLNQNWNWISFNLVIPNNTPLNTTLQDGNWIMDDVMKNEAASTFANYTMTNGIGWTGTLKTLDNLTAYKLKVTTAQSLPVNGTAVDVTKTSITLKGNPAWSYISYLPPFNATLKDALAGYKGVDQDVIKSQTGFAMYSGAANAWIGSLTYMEPGKGYMFLRKRTNDTTFKYPTISGSLLGGRVIEGAAATAEQRPVPANFTHADNMTVIAVIASGTDFRVGDSLIAYVNGEIGGKAKPIQNPDINKYTYFFNISGDGDQPIVFALERGGTIVAQSTTVIRYGANRMVGTLTNPLELQFVNNANVITVNPNPFNTSAIINVELGTLSAANNPQVQVTVFDIAGRMVWSTPAQRVSGTRYTTTWNGSNYKGATCAAGVYVVQVLLNDVPHVYKLVKQ